jgi:formylglycine-generating enzyme required for sulfatase activity/HEAT repeat protein
MPTQDRIGGPRDRESLDCVLDLFLKLAFDQDKTWKAIKSGISKKKQTSGRTAKDIEAAVALEIESLKYSLEIKLVNFEDLRASIDTVKLSQQAARESGEAFLLLKRADRGVSTVDAIHKCIDYSQSAPSTGATHKKTGGLTSEKVRNALRFLQKLDLYLSCIGRKEQGSVYRHFALNFSSCQPLTQEKCEKLIKTQLDRHEKGPEAAPASAKPNTAPKGKDAALRKKLDALVAALLPQAKANFKTRRKADKKHIHVPLKAIILPADWDMEKQDLPEARVPQPEDLMDLVAGEDTRLLLIREEGGAGKTSLAYEIASWGLDGRLAEHQQSLLPYFLNFGGDDLEDLPPLKRQILDFLTTIKVNIHIDEGDIDNLLRHKRVMVIVDHYSELTEKQRAWVLRELCGCALVLLTSRLGIYNVDFIGRGWKVAEIQPQRLEDQELFDFFEQYLLQRGGDHQDGCKVVLGPDDIIRTHNLLERMVGHKPVTVLLAWLVIDKAIKHIEQRGSNSAPGPVDLLPSSVPQLMETYVKETCGHKSGTVGSLKPLKYNPYPEIILAFLKALALEAHRQKKAYHPQNFDKSVAERALAAAGLDGKDLPPQDLNVLLDDLVTKLTLVTRIESSYDTESYRISLDPLADYLAALAQREIWLGSGNDEANAHFQMVSGWLKGLKARLELGKKEDDHELAALDNMKGFLAACRDCYTQWLNQQADHLSESEKKEWQTCLNDFAALAKIDPKEERKLEIKHLIRRHAFDLEWNNEELRSKAIAELTAYAQELKAKHHSEPSRCAAGGIPEMAIAVPPLELSLVEPSFSDADRTAAAEALGHIGGPRAAKALRTMLANTHEPQVAVRRAAAEALGLLDVSPDDPQAHWDLLAAVLQNQANHLHGETDWAAIDQKLPLLQGASRGLQRLAALSNIDRLKVWGAENSLKVPMLTLSIAAGAVTTRMVLIQVWQLPLPGGLSLELVAIPEGELHMGSPKQEEGRDAYGQIPAALGEEVEAQRLVRLPAFAMARCLISQVQWREVAKLPMVMRPLNVDPAQAKGAELPVECVSREDSLEWCDRLNCHLRQELGEAFPMVTLPSETQWEYACRAGSSTPFHFGDTIDAAWANYNAEGAYCGGKAGVYVNRTTPVGAYGLVNRWGLSDMHGNVWEWCLDRWHPSQQDQCPSAGSTTLQPNFYLPYIRVLRGGSWDSLPRLCRSAYRLIPHPDDRIGFGFRVCCLPPGLPS